MANNRSLKTRILQECHDAWGHLGADKTLQRLEMQFHWLNAARDVREYVGSCVKCKEAKADHQTTQGLLQPLPIPERSWSMIHLDLIGPLKTTRKGNNAILVVIDRFSKQAHYMPTRMNVTAVGIARLIWDHIVRHHGIPTSIVSDRDPRWTSHFWRELWKLSGTKLKMSTSFHPQTDGLVERQNKTLEEMLRSSINTEWDDWDLHLTSAEIAYNTSVQKSTGKTPFFLNNGREMHLPLQIAAEKENVSSNPTAAEMWSQWNATVEKVKTKLVKEQALQTKYTNQHRRETTYAVGDQVFVSTRNWPAFAHKLSSRYVGPFRIIGLIGENAIKVELPPQLSQKHDVINVSRVKKFNIDQSKWPGRQQISRPLPDVINGEEEYEVEAILAHRKRKMRRNNNNELEYLVSWCGYDISEASWLTKEALGNSQELMQEYEERIRQVNTESETTENFINTLLS